MSLAVVHSRAIVGLDALPVQIEVHLSQGLPALTIVGLPEGAVRESKDRVRSAIINSGFDFPNRRLTINLAPADLPKEGARLDLPIALGILAASGQIDDEILKSFEFVGELALTGELRGVTGVLSIAQAARKAMHRLAVPYENAIQASLLNESPVYGVHNLKELVEQLKNPDWRPVSTTQLSSSSFSFPDMREVKGQFKAKRALEIAAAGGHSILLSGPPGAGKTLLASRLPGILPILEAHEILEIANVYSVANMSLSLGERPFRAPHHTSSAVALVGGGSNPRPGEITLAHKGVLFLDELPEFDRKVIEVLRQPLESREIVISRAARQVTFPAHFQLVAAMNPCPCGYAGVKDRCRCTPEQIARYKGKLSGPLLDRIDLQIFVSAMSISDLTQESVEERSEVIRERVQKARDHQLARQKMPNSHLSGEMLSQQIILGDSEKQLLAKAQQKLNLSGRSYHRVLRVARTIADLALSEHVESTHIAEALGYRQMG